MQQSFFLLAKVEREGVPKGRPNDFIISMSKVSPKPLNSRFFNKETFKFLSKSKIFSSLPYGILTFIFHTFKIIKIIFSLLSQLTLSLVRLVSSEKFFECSYFFFWYFVHI
jgi:hypothetical protein